MKKITALFVCMMLSFSLFSCKDEKTNEKSAVSESTTTENITENSKNEAPAYEEPSDILIDVDGNEIDDNGSTEKTAAEATQDGAIKTLEKYAASMIENHDYGIASCLYPSGILNDLIESGEVEVEGSSMSEEENKNKLVRFGIADCRKLGEKAYNGAKSYFMYKAKMFELKDFDCKVTDGYAMKMNIEAEYGEKGDGDYSEYVSGWKELTVVMLENEGWYIIFSGENELIDSASDAVN